MKRILLFQKIENIKAASQFEHKLIDSIWIIMQMKRKAEFEYKLSLEAINRELQRYVVQDNGFLTDIIKAFQSYITVIYTNQNALIDGYDHQILSFLQQAKTTQMEEELIQQVKGFDARITQTQDKILNVTEKNMQIKRTIKENEGELQVISHQVKLNSRIGTMTEEEKQKAAETYKKFSTSKQLEEDKLEAEVDGMMSLTMTHNHILQALDQYQTVYLQKKGSDVFDNFMRAFVLQVSFIRSMQFDVGNILQKVKDRQEEHKKVALQSLKQRMHKQTSAMTHFIRDAYKKLTNNFLLDISQPYISPRIKNKWSSICEYYNGAN